MPASRFFAHRRTFVSLLKRGALAAVALVLCGTVFAGRVFAAVNPVPFVDTVSTGQHKSWCYWSNAYRTRSGIRFDFHCGMEWNTAYHDFSE